jgi:preprotein translocase subunit SecY
VSNPILDTLNIPELKRRGLITLGLLFVYRLGSHIPTPGVNSAVMQRLMSSQSNSMLGFMDLFSGGALSQFSVFALGIMPYISTSIILQLLTEVWPYLKQLSKEGEAGRKKINQYTRYGTVLLAGIHAVGMTNILRGIAHSSNLPLILDDSVGWVMMTILTLTTGTMFVMWLGEQITEFGIGNGISLIIFIGIVARIPREFLAMYQAYDAGNVSAFGILFFLIAMMALVALTVTLQQAFRRIPVQYAQRQVGRRLMSGGTTMLPLKVDYSGVIAVIFASSLLVFPIQIIGFIKNAPMVAKSTAMVQYLELIEGMLSHGSVLYTLCYAGLIVFFCYFYTALIFNPDDVAENMKKYGGFIPGLRPGKSTAEYIGRILDRITLGGALTVVTIAVLPDFLARGMTIGWYFGGTTLLIVVGVALDTMRQVESHLLMRQYEGFMKNVKIRGRQGW